ncbi:hypothetical protein L1049_019032 [Liquidambar formosana]|uniref:Pentatricopeptide repeat-containing protein n=1 Tax=Liquidambar formosana TaxID=63359 RepID=A0AAP0RB02_LIQFO
MQKVEELVGDMLRNGHVIDASLYSFLVKGYGEDGNEEMAMRVFHESIDMGYMINLESFSVIVKELYGKGKLHEVEKLLEELSRSFPVINVDSYRRVLDEHLCESI